MYCASPPQCRDALPALNIMADGGESAPRASLYANRASIGTCPGIPCDSLDKGFSPILPLLPALHVREGLSGGECLTSPTRTNTILQWSCHSPSSAGIGLRLLSLRSGGPDVHTHGLAQHRAFGDRADLDNRRSRLHVACTAMLAANITSWVLIFRGGYTGRG